MPIISFDAVLLDLDGTLCGYTATPYQALRQTLAHLAEALLVRLDEAAFERLNATVWREGQRRLEAGEANPFPLGAGAEAVSRWLTRHTVDEAQQQALQRAYLDTLLDHLALLPGAEALLAALAGVRLGLITNGPSPLQWGKIDRLEIGSHFDAIVVSGDLGIHKPDPRIFFDALARLGVQPPRALFVGDSLEHDVRGAKQAGMWAAWLHPDGQALEGGQPAPDVTVRNLSELLRWLAENGRGAP